jgi:hypothetical protein
MAEDRSEGWDDAGGLQEPAGKGVAQIVAPERHTGSAGNISEAIGEGGIPLPFTVPEHVCRGGMPRCAGQCADGGVAQWHDRPVGLMSWSLSA